MQGWTIAACSVGLYVFVGCAAAPADHDGAVLDGVGHVADAGEGDQGEGCDFFALPAAGVPAQRVSAALVTGIQQPA